MNDIPKRDELSDLARAVTNAEDYLNGEFVQSDAKRALEIEQEIKELLAEQAGRQETVADAEQQLTNARAALAAHVAAPTMQDVADAVAEIADDPPIGEEAEAPEDTPAEAVADGETRETVPLDGTLTAEQALAAGKADQRAHDRATKGDPWT